MSAATRCRNRKSVAGVIRCGKDRIDGPFAMQPDTQGALLLRVLKLSCRRTCARRRRAPGSLDSDSGTYDSWGLHLNYDRRSFALPPVVPQNPPPEDPL